VRDRIDLMVPVPRQSYDVIFPGDAADDAPEPVGARVADARRRQHERNPGLVERCAPPGRRRRRRAVSAEAAPGLPARLRSDLNGDLDGMLLLAACDPTPAASRLLSLAGERLQLSARSFHRVLRVARTIADLAGESRVDEAALGEALRFRGEVHR
jgi:predicted ATPase with chaperone activity